jgi:3-isopropylmalate/(R)-2-methylmalate dehydratase large subunit
MGMMPETPMEDIRIDHAFVGSWTNSRIDRLREVAKVMTSSKIAISPPSHGWPEAQGVGHV